MVRDVNVPKVRDGLEVVPNYWEEYHEPVAAGTRTIAVDIYAGPAPGEPNQNWDPVARVDRPNHGTWLYQTSARIQRLITGQEEPAGGREATSQRYLVTLHRDRAPSLLNRIRVIPGGDPLLDGKYLSIIDVQGGSLRWERDLICLDNLG